ASTVFNQCKVCHSAEAGAANLTGPNLYGVVGRPAASTEGFAYSPVLRNSGITWDEQTLDEFLASPLTYLPNNRMAFGGVTNEEDRRAVVCLLTTLR
ncbi:MAG: cytochrome c family protein, partial [Pseudomonadota bacterium]